MWNTGRDEHLVAFVALIQEWIVSKEIMFSKIHLAPILLYLLSSTPSLTDVIPIYNMLRATRLKASVQFVYKEHTDLIAHTS
jgi:hypothetical protein